ncbi:MAG: hypothetical protein M3Y56_09415 [Armatimonadota bacterium]|nr:hypothetical protein [Armatimonadota bacterium]
MIAPTLPKLLLPLILILALPTPAQTAPAPNPGREAQRVEWPLLTGDVWLMIGDTANRARMDDLAAAALARYPRGGFVIRRSLAVGNTYPAAVDRLLHETTQWKPSLLTVDLGMTDCVSWYPHSLDFLTNPGSPLKALLDSTREANQRLFLVSPSAWDDLPAGLDRPVLEEFLRKVHGFTMLNNLPYLDVYAPAQAIGLPPGGIDAGATAQLLDAAMIFKAMGADGLVSSVEIDAGNGKLIRSERATVSDIHCTGASLRFQRLDESLPFPVPPDARAALRASGSTLLGSPQNLFGMSRYELTVQGLPPGRYRLSIDGQVVATVTSSELEGGYGAGLLDRGPVYDQGQQLLAAVKGADGTPASDKITHDAATPKPHIWSLKLDETN